MGPEMNPVPHEQQSSRMSLVQGWKHENVRLYTIAFAMVCAVVLMFSVLLYGTSLKSVTIIVDGKKLQVETRQATTQRLLDEQAVKIGPHDRLSADLQAPVRHGDVLTVVRSIPIQVTMRGETRTLYTTKKTVREALYASSYVMDSDDKLMPAPEAAIRAGLQVKIVQVNTMFIEQTKTIPYDVVTKKDSSLSLGKQKIIRPGQNGEILKKIKKTFEDGKMTSIQVLDERVVASKQDRVVSVGTSKPVQVASTPMPVIGTIKKSGVHFSVKKVLSNVTLTAYSADYQSTRKKKGSKGYGVTASGTKVKEGQTIAVDPKVIPIGYWVYIEGVGFRRAEDRGSAVKGAKIDVFFDTHREAVQFGRQKGKTVYIIGPSQPKAH
jgi:uncharacterized protein YabE (DUF348 family)/3D (Asp-Asp-Asp) domain-containing protein